MQEPMGVPKVFLKKDFLYEKNSRIQTYLETLFDVRDTETCRRRQRIIRCEKLQHEGKSLVNRHRCKQARDVQEAEPELSKFFRSRIGLRVKFSVKTGVGVGAGVTIS